MSRFHHIHFIAAVLFSASLSACGDPSKRFDYTAGHADIALSITSQGGEVIWDAFLLAHIDAIIDGSRVQGSVSFEDITIRSSAYLTRPQDDSGAFESLCVPNGSTAAWLPQGLRDARDFDAPFLGISAEAEPGLLMEDTISLKLIDVVSSSGTGAYSLWRDGFPPTFFMSSCDGISEEDVLHIPLGHDHYNMGFSEIGQWTLTYEASAQLADGTTTNHEFRVHYVLE